METVEKKTEEILKILKGLTLRQYKQIIRLLEDKVTDTYKII